MARSRVLVAVVVATVALGGCAWTQIRGNPQRSGVNYVAPGVTTATLSALQPAWTSPDRGATAQEVTAADGRAFIAGGTALWAVDLATGADLWHVERTNGHQTNQLLPPTVWSDHGTPIVGMNQFWSDSISGTPYFQWLARIDQLDPATGDLLGTRTTAAQTPPLDAGDWIYFPVNHIVAQPASFGPSVIDLHLDGRALDGSGASFTIPFNSPINPISSLAVNNGTLYLRTLQGLVAYPAHGCGTATCTTPTWQASITGVSQVGQIAVVRDRVYDLSPNKLSALDADGCGAPTCTTLWQADLAYTPIGIAATPDRVYVTAGPTLSVFDAHGCGAATCTPLWTSTGSGALTAPSVANDVVFAGSTNGDLRAWSVDGCGAATCDARWTQPQEAAVGPVTVVPSGLLFTVGGAVRKLVVP